LTEEYSYLVIQSTLIMGSYRPGAAVPGYVVTMEGDEEEEEKGRQHEQLDKSESLLMAVSQNGLLLSDA